MGTKRYEGKKSLDDLLKIKTDDIVYMAGFFDGEGSICIITGTHNLQVQLSNTDQKIMEWIAETFGGHARAKKKYKSQHRKAWVWQLNSGAAMEFLIVIGGRLKIKHRQAKLAIQFQMEKAHFMGDGRKEKISESEFELRELYRQQMRALNAGD